MISFLNFVLPILLFKSSTFLKIFLFFFNLSILTKAILCFSKKYNQILMLQPNFYAFYSKLLLKVSVVYVGTEGMVFSRKKNKNLYTYK